MDVEITWLYEELTREITAADMKALREEARRWASGVYTEEDREEFEQYALEIDAGLYESFAVAAYLLLRQHASSDPWHHGLDLDEIVARDGRLFWKNAGRHRALFDRRWVFDEKVDTDTWHTTIMRVLEWIERHGHDPSKLLSLVYDNQPRLERLLRNFTINTRWRLWRNKEYAIGSPEGYVDANDNPARNREVPPPKGFRLPPPHSWRRQFLAHDPWGELDLEVDVHRALTKLSPVDHALFIRHHAFGATIQSLAVGIPLGTVKSKLVASMRKVRDWLNETPPKRRGRPPKINIINGHPIAPNSGLIDYMRGVAGDLSHRQNGAGPSACAAPPLEEKWPCRSLSPDDSWRQKILKWQEEGTHGQKLVWASLRHGSIQESWTRHKTMSAFF
jgi:hypothetical protein